MVPGAHAEAVRQPTVKEVATLAGVSPMTVSRTIAGAKNVRPEVRSESSKRYGRWAIIVTRTRGECGPAWQAAWWGSHHQPRESVLRKLGSRRRRDRRTAWPPHHSRKHRRRPSTGTPADRRLPRPTGTGSHRRTGGRGCLAPPARRAGRYAPRSCFGAYRGTRCLLVAGHRRIAYLGNVASVSTGHRRFEGFTRALEDFDLTPNPMLVKRDHQDVESARQAMSILLDLAEPPTAVFCANNRNTIGALKAIGARLREAGPAPTAPAIVSFDHFELAELMPAPVTVIDHDPRELGR